MRNFRTCPILALPFSDENPCLAPFPKFGSPPTGRPENQIQEIEAAGFRVEPHRVISETISGSVAVSARPAGKMTMNVINAVAQFERDLLIERTNAGLRRAKSEGTKLGRPTASSQRAEIISALEDGQKVAPLAKRFDVSRQTIMRIRDLVHGGADAGKTLGRGDTRAVGTLQTMPDELFEKAKAELARYDLESEDERIDELPTRQLIRDRLPPSGLAKLPSVARLRQLHFGKSPDDPFDPVGYVRACASGI